MYNVLALEDELALKRIKDMEMELSQNAEMMKNYEDNF